jgi:hypothetical protein
MPWKHMGSEGIAPSFLILALDVGDWSTSRSLRFIPGDIASRQPLDKRLGGSQSRSGHCGEEKKSISPARNRTLVVQSVT